MHVNPVKNESCMMANLPSFLACRSSLAELVGKKVRFSLRNNHYDPMILFEADCIDISDGKGQLRFEEKQLPEDYLCIENNKGIEINLPLQNLIRIEGPTGSNPNEYFLIFQRHFWTMEILG